MIFLVLQFYLFNEHFSDILYVFNVESTYLTYLGIHAHSHNETRDDHDGIPGRANEPNRLVDNA